MRVLRELRLHRLQDGWRESSPKQVFQNLTVADCRVGGVGILNSGGGLHSAYIQEFANKKPFSERFLSRRRVEVHSHKNNFSPTTPNDSQRQSTDKFSTKWYTDVCFSFSLQTATIGERLLFYF